MIDPILLSATTATPIEGSGSVEGEPSMFAVLFSAVTGKVAGDDANDANDGADHGAGHDDPSLEGADHALHAADRSGHGAEHAADRSGHGAEHAGDRSGHGAEHAADRSGLGAEHAADRSGHGAGEVLHATEHPDHIDLRQQPESEEPRIVPPGERPAGAQLAPAGVPLSSPSVQTDQTAVVVGDQRTGDSQPVVAVDAHSEKEQSVTGQGGHESVDIATDPGLGVVGRSSETVTGLENAVPTSVPGRNAEPGSANGGTAHPHESVNLVASQNSANTSAAQVARPETLPPGSHDHVQATPSAERHVVEMPTPAKAPEQPTVVRGRATPPHLPAIDTQSRLAGKPEADPVRPLQTVPVFDLSENAQALNPIERLNSGGVERVQSEGLIRPTVLRLAERIETWIRQSENMPPPWTMLIKGPGLDGMTIRVSMGLHGLSIQVEGATEQDLIWVRKVGEQLIERGFDVNDLTEYSEDEPGRPASDKSPPKDRKSTREFTLPSDDELNQGDAHD